MAFIKWKELSGFENFLRFDATLSEDIEFDTEISTSPIESRIEAANHVILKPLKIQIEAHVSDSPIIPPTDNNNGVQGSRRRHYIDLRPNNPNLPPRRRGGLPNTSDFAPPDPAAVEATVLGFDGRLTRKVNVINQLRYLIDNSVLVTLVMNPELQYENLFIKNFIFSQSGGDIATFLLEFQQVLFYSTEVVEFKEAKKPAVAPPKDKGVKTEKKTTLGRGTTTQQRSAAEAASEGFERFLGP